MRHFLQACTGLILVLLSASLLWADIRLPKIFSDKMVLQRGSSIRVWGTADAGEELAISLGENQVDTTADDQGRWSVDVEAPPAGGPYELVVEGKESRVLFSDVLIGEVWICSIQSNLQWTLDESMSFVTDEEREKFFSEINYPRLRLFTVPDNAVNEPASDFTELVAWEECTQDSAASFSAVAWFFACELKKNEKFRDMPIGLIESSWGGTPGEAWLSRTALDAEANLEPLLKHWDENQDRSPNRPANLYNGMIAPLVPFSVRGALWYQGEANVGRAHQYRTLFPALINDWRARFDQGDFPFYYVQLAPYRSTNHDPRALAELWDAQREAMKVPNTAMVGSSDVSIAGETQPGSREIIGRRLARLALAHTYGEVEVVWSGPIFDHFEKSDGGRLVLHFDHNLGLKHGGESLDGFLICGEDHEFKPATAEIVDDTVVVWSPDVPNPVHVRYLWNDSAVASLFNAADLPAIPFRSDDIKLLSEGQDF